MRFGSNAKEAAEEPGRGSGGGWIIRFALRSGSGSAFTPNSVPSLYPRGFPKQRCTSISNAKESFRNRSNIWMWRLNSSNSNANKPTITFR